MRFKTLVLTIAGMALLAVPAFAQQSIRDAVYADADKAGGVYYMYPFHEHVSTPAPKGYKPVYLSHYGRHGARWLLNETQYVRSLDVLKAAHEQGALTEEGGRIWTAVEAYFESVCRYRWGDLTPLGFDQHYRIAEEIFRDNKAFFKKNPVIRASATQIPRCIVSMSAFCEGLLHQRPSLYIFQEASKFNLDDLSPHAKENPRRVNVQMEEGRYKRKDPWGTDLKTFIDARVDSKSIAGRIFKDPDFPSLFRGTRAFVTDFYDLVFNMQCTPTDLRLYDFFTPDERYALWEVNNYIHYMEAAPPATMRDLPALWNLLDDADAALAAGKPAARFRFGHDTVFLALISMMGADGFDIVPATADDLSKTWYNYRAPMAATFYLLLCKNKQGDVIFKLVVNGDEAVLPLKAVSGPWYRWNDLKALMAQRFTREG